MTSRSTLIYTPEYLQYQFSPEHPLNPIRVELAHDLMVECGLLDGANETVVAPKAASDDEIALVHTERYIRRVKELGEIGPAAPPDIRFGLGTADNPIFKGMHEACSLVVGGSLTAGSAVMTGSSARAFNLAGGLHHGLAELAAGFCIYNDPAILIAALRRQGFERILYIDTDAHHGDGVQWIYYRTSQVLTISFHETGECLFPGTGSIDEIGEGDGLGFSVNVPLRPATSDESYLLAFEEVVPALARAYRPDVIVTQNGCDGHVLDPLTHLCLTTHSFETVARRERDLADELCDGRLIAMGGGGYAIWDVVPRAWTLVWAAFSGQEIPEAVPETWRERWSAHFNRPMPAWLRDRPETFASTAESVQTRKANLETARSVVEKALPYVEQVGRTT